ncbi:MAG: mycofactocin biosynthesis chaperone MftB [Solirubrobacteraceae bacterium]
MPFELERAWRLDRQVALRPEPFGALAYHFGTRRLSFLKSRKLFEVVRALDDQPTALAACRCAGVTERELPVYRRALETLASSGMVVEGDHA